MSRKKNSQNHELQRIDDFCAAIPESKRKLFGIRRIKEILDEQYEEEAPQ